MLFRTMNILIAGIKKMHVKDEVAILKSNNKVKPEKLM